MIKFICLIFLAGSALSDPQPKVLSSNIVGGNYVQNKGNFPYQVELLLHQNSFLWKTSVYFCGGSLISSKYVLTAAHCMYDKQIPQDIEVKAGNLLLDKTVQTSFVKKISIHPQYDQEMNDYDAALLELETPMVFDKNVQPIELSTSTPKENSKAIVSGWGKMDENGKRVSRALKYAVVPIWSHDKCKRVQRPFIVTDRMICAGYTYGGADACSGDSGGPLVVNKKLAGIVSWGIGCGRAYRPGIYTDVSKIIDWINSVMNNTPFNSNNNIASIEPSTNSYDTYYIIF